MDMGAGFADTRTTLHRIAAHILGRRRHDVTGRFGLRPTAGGFATPAFGADVEVLRVAGTVLVRERSGDARYLDLRNSTLRELARFAGTSLSAEFSVGSDTPELGDVDAPLEVDPEGCRVVASWFGLGQRVVDRLCAGLPAESPPSVAQLWPEHFDLGSDVGLPNGGRANVGASPGDGFCPEPYLYLGPWGDDRPGDPGYWNAPFGAVLRRSELPASAPRAEAGAAFLRLGLEALAAG